MGKHLTALSISFNPQNNMDSAGSAPVEELWFSPCGTSSCIEVSPSTPPAVSGDGVLIRTTSSAVFLTATNDEWWAFIDAAKAGKLDNVRPRTALVP